MKRLLLFLTLALTAVPLFGEVWKHAETGLELPETAGEFKRAGVHTYKQAPLGVSLKYLKGPIVADVYIYNMNESDIPNGISKQSVFQLASAARDIKEMERLGHYSGVTLGELNAVLMFEDEAKHYKFPLHHLQGGYTLNGEAKQSHIFLFGWKKNFIKMRITYPKQNAEQSFKDVIDFLNALEPCFEFEKNPPERPQEQKPIAP